MVEAAVAEATVSPDGQFDGFGFAPELAIFAGHFPGNPLVPGIYLLDAARLLVGRHQGLDLAIREVIDARFTAEVRPGDQLSGQLELRSETDGQLRAEVRFRVGEVAAARIRLLLAPADRDCLTGSNSGD